MLMKRAALAVGVTLLVAGCPEPPPDGKDASVRADASRPDAEDIIIGGEDSGLPSGADGGEESTGIGWCALHFPPSADIAVGARLTAYGQVYVEGETSQVGARADLEGQLGYGAQGSDGASDDGTWQWTDADYNKDDGNNDEYRAEISPGLGSWSYAFRFRYKRGAWRMCDLNGSADGYDKAQQGALTVNPVVPPSISWCKVVSGAAASAKLGEDARIYGQVLAVGVTDAAGQGAGLVGEVGFGPLASDPTAPGGGGWTWRAASFNKDVGANDEYEGRLAPGEPGQYAFAYRFRLGAGEAVYCDTDTAGTGFDKTRLGTLEVSEQTVGWCNVQHPASATVAVGGALTVYGQVYLEGETDQAGPRPDIECQLGYGPQGTDGSSDGTWLWTDATFHTDDTASANNDEYLADISPPLGSWSYAYRFRYKDGPWRMCDLNGSADGYDRTRQGALTVTPAVPPSISWCRIVSSAAVSAKLGQDARVYGQVLAVGVTDSAGQGAGVVGEVGYGPPGSDPSAAGSAWSWSAASFNKDVGDNDEYEGQLAPAAPGSYAFGYRFRLGSGEAVYCDSDADGAAFSKDALGTLEVTAPAVDWCRLQFPPAANLTPGEDLRAFGQVLVAGTTDQLGEGADVEGELGVGPAGTDGSTSPAWTWTAATFHKDEGANDEHQATVAAGAVGDYAYAFRFRFKGGPWTWCDLDSSANGFQQAQQGALAVASARPKQIDWCNLQFPASAQATLGDPTTVYGQVFVAGVTEADGAGAEVVGELGIGPAGADAWAGDGAAFTWTAASFNTQHGSNDEFSGTLDPAAVGEYAYAFRFRYQDGAWTYCDLDSSANGFSADQQGRLTVAAVKPPAVDWCRLQWPPGGQLAEGESLVVYGQVWVNGVTEPAGQGAEIEGELGLGGVQSDGSTDGSWTWVSAAWGTDVGNNDEYRASLSPAPGAYAYAYRFRYKGGTWTYCDLDSSGNGYEPGQQGWLQVRPKAVDFCILQWPPSGSAEAGTPLTVYAQAYMAGVTELAGAQAELEAELGHGAAGTDGTSDATWSWQAATFNGDKGNNDEYQGALAPAEGNWAYAYRFRYGGGAWTYCDLDGSSNGYDKDQQGLLTVTGPPATGVLLGPGPRVENEGTQLSAGLMVTVPGVTVQPGQAAAVTGVELGLGPEGSTPGAGWTWTPMAYFGDLFGGDGYEAWLTAPAPGRYALAARFVYGGQTYTTDLMPLQTLAEPAAAGNDVGWCNLQWPLTIDHASGAELPVVYGRVYVAGISDHVGGDSRIQGQFGYGPDGSSPRTDRWYWTDVAYSNDVDGLSPGDLANDEYATSEHLTFTAPAATYRYAYRFRSANGWTYCDTDGSSGLEGFDPAKTGILTVH